MTPMVRRALPLVAAAALLLGGRLSAQQESDAALRAGATAARVLIDPFPVSFGRGDSIAVRIALLDSVGGTVTGALWSLETDGRSVQHRLIDSTTEFRRYSFSGSDPGS